MLPQHIFVCNTNFFIRMNRCIDSDQWCIGTGHLLTDFGSNALICSTKNRGINFCSMSAIF